MAAEVASAVNGLDRNAHDEDLPENPLDDQDEGDLFGDEDAGEQLQNDLDRKLDDSDLDSGDDEGRADRVAVTVEEDEDEDTEEQRAEIKLCNADISRVKPPEGDQLYLLNMPNFLGVKHQNFNPATYVPPTKPHDLDDPDAKVDPNFSSFDAAASSIYWRRDPKDPSLLQSNARIIRWTDGSLTLQHASNPKDQYRITLQPLRQNFNPTHKTLSQHNYDPSRDSHIYLAAPHIEAGVDLQIMAPLDASMRIHPSESQVDESLSALQATLAAQAQQQHDPLQNLRQIKEDPELGRKAAEIFEKDQQRSTRKREAAEERLVTRRTRVLGRSGLGGSGGAGLSVAGLEGDEMPTARGRKSNRPGGPARRKNMGRGDIYSDDEDETLPRGRTREDEYDREDDFLADSDEEPEIYDDGEGEGAEEEADAEGEDDPDVDDLEIEGRKTVVEERTRGGRDRAATPPKRSVRDEEAEDGEVGGAGGTAQRKKRRVIDEDEEEE